MEQLCGLHKMCAFFTCMHNVQIEKMQCYYLAYIVLCMGVATNCVHDNYVYTLIVPLFVCRVATLCENCHSTVFKLEWFDIYILCKYVHVCIVTVHVVCTCDVLHYNGCQDFFRLKFIN